MSGLFIANCEAFLRHPEEDVRVWANVYNLLAMNVSLVDRTEQFKTPFNFELYRDFKLPRDLSNFNMTYEECCQQRVMQLLALQEKAKVPIALFYSGGIDSTLVLISFAKILGHDLKNKVTVFLSPDSIEENPNFYYKFVRKNCRIESSERFSSLFDRSHIIVGGEHNDQLFGSDLIGGIVRKYGFEQVMRPYRRKFITKYFVQRGMTPAAADIWFDIIDAHAKSAPCEVKSVFQFFWWLNFAFKWQSVFFRMLLRVDAIHRKLINQDFVNTHYHHFFSSAEFQKWAMLNPDKKIRDSWVSYKHAAKELIFNFTGDQDYFDNKAKKGSLGRLFLQKNCAIGLTSDYEYIDGLEPSDFYAKDNSFSAALAHEREVKVAA